MINKYVYGHLFYDSIHNNYYNLCKCYFKEVDFIIIWNSKTIHSNKGMLKNNIELNRLTFYIAYLPRSLQTEENRLKRIDAYKNGSTCSHWSNQCEIKQYPWGFKKNYEKKGFHNIIPLIIDGKIPYDRYSLL